MSARIEREIERFEALQKDGRLVVIIEMQSFIDVTDSESKGIEWLAGLKRWELLNGTPVNKIDDNTFKIVSTGEVVRRIAANNPSSSG